MNPATDWIDQAQRLFDALKGPVGGNAPASATDGGTPADAHSADCRWCPICQAAAVVRGERPEVAAALADVLASAATALRTFAAGGQPQAPGSAGGAAAGAGRQESGNDQADGDPPPAVQQIEVA
jgi:hypothetical protein